MGAAAWLQARWPGAIEAGELVLAKDTSVLRDSTFFLKLATASRAHGQPFKAIEGRERMFLADFNRMRNVA